MTYETISLDVADKVATITLNRPERMNACSLDMAGEINDAVSTLTDARCLIITGAGRGFCSGADLQARGKTSIAGGEGSYIALTRHYNPLMVNLARLNMPIITAITGGAVAVAAAFLPVGKLADIANAGTLYAFMMVAIAVMILRKTAADTPRAFKTPALWLIGPATIAGTVFLFFNLPLDAMLVLPIWGAIGLLIYFLYSRSRSHLGKGIVESHEVEAVTEIEPHTPGTH